MVLSSQNYDLLHWDHLNEAICILMQVTVWTATAVFAPIDIMALVNDILKLLCQVSARKSSCRAEVCDTPISPNNKQHSGVGVSMHGSEHDGLKVHQR